MSIIGLDWNSPTTQLLAVGAVGAGLYWWMNYMPASGSGVAAAQTKATSDNLEKQRQGKKELTRATDNSSVYPYVSVLELGADH